MYRERLVCNLVGVGENKLQLDGKVCLENKMSISALVDITGSVFELMMWIPLFCNEMFLVERNVALKGSRWFL